MLSWNSPSMGARVLMLAHFCRLETFTALRARLAALLVLVLLATGAINGSPARVEAASRHDLRGGPLRIERLPSVPDEALRRNGQRTRWEGTTRRNLAH